MSRAPWPPAQPEEGEGLDTAPLESLEGVREEWSRLAGLTGNVFSTWEWAAAWWRHFGASRRLQLIGCRRSDGRLAAILPLYRASERPVGSLRFVGHGVADQLGPLCAAEDRAATGRALRSALAHPRPSCHLLVAERTAAEDGWGHLTAGRVVRREPSPSLGIEGRTWEEFLQQRSANFRSQLRRRERTLVRNHGLRFRLATDAERLDRDMDTLFRLHRSRWGNGGSTGFAIGTRAAFHRDFAHSALARGWLRLWFAELRGEPVAAWYGFRFGRAEWYYQAGRARDWDHASVGFVLLAHSIREAFADGMTEYRLLLGGEPYKDRFSDRDRAVETVLLTRGLLGRAGGAALARATLLPPGARRWLRRKAG